MADPVDISGLLAACGVNHPGSVSILANMPCLEPNPKDDWLYLGIMSLKEISMRKGSDVSSIANIGSGSGIDAIAELELFQSLKRISVTDILPELLPGIKSNIMRNMPEKCRGVSFDFLAGRDCSPLESRHDLIYANLPLVMVGPNELNDDLAKVSLADARPYMHLSEGKGDILLRCSLLSQLGFLLSAKPKLSKGGRIITLLGGRVLPESIDELFSRAGLKYRQMLCSFKAQSDSEVIRKYALYESSHGIDFCFYDFAKASKILGDCFNADVPGLVQEALWTELRAALLPAKVNAKQAYKMSSNGWQVGHLAFSFEAFR